MAKTWFLPPQFTFFPEGEIRLCMILKYPDRPTPALASLDPEETPHIPLPAVTTITETGHAHSAGAGIFAKFVDLASISGSADVSKEVSPELIDHVLAHVYQFSLRALPWPKPVKHSLSKTVGTFTPPQDKKVKEALLKWLGGVEDESVTVPQLPALEASPKVDFSEVVDETGYVQYDEYFDTKWISGFSEQSSISFDSSSSIISGSPLQVIPTISDMRGVVDREDDGKPGTQEPEDPSPPDPARSVAAQDQDNYSRQHLSRTQPRMPSSDNSQHISLLVGPAISTSSDLAKGRGKADRRQDKKLESGRIWLFEGMPLKYLIIGISSHFQIKPIQGSLGQDLDGLWDDDTIRRARAELSAAVHSFSGFKTRGFVESQVVKDWLQSIETSGYRWLLGIPGEQEISEGASVILNDSSVGSLSISRKGAERRAGDKVEEIDTTNLIQVPWAAPQPQWRGSP